MTYINNEKIIIDVSYISTITYCIHKELFKLVSSPGLHNIKNIFLKPIHMCEYMFCAFNNEYWTYKAFKNTFCLTIAGFKSFLWKCCCCGFQEVLGIQLGVSDPPRTPYISPCSLPSTSCIQGTLSLSFGFIFIIKDLQAYGWIRISTSTTRGSLYMIWKSCGHHRYWDKISYITLTFNIYL